MNNNPIEYIGDGVYVEYDGYGYWLLANDHIHPTDRVYLEPDVLKALNNFIDRIKKERLKNASKKIIL